MLPLYSQVVVQDAGTADIPRWEAGDERAVHTTHSLAILTRSDMDGDVTMTVLQGTDTQGLGSQVFDGEILLTSPMLEIGSPIGADVFGVEVGNLGLLRLRVFVQPAKRPSSVVVLLHMPNQEAVSQPP